MTAAWHLIGEPRADGVLIIADHASNHVPAEIDLGVDAGLLEQHIAWDIGVGGVAEILGKQSGWAAFLGTHSRLVVDLNRYADEPAVVPCISDGHFITGNNIDIGAREVRLGRYFHLYHNELARILARHRPALILSLHSFTPRLESDPLEERPWEIGILYNEYEIASHHAIAFLQSRRVVVGDQLPYSGKLLNATMNRHAEGNGIPYVGVEIRQDLISDACGQQRYANLLAEMVCAVVTRIGSAVS